MATAPANIFAQRMQPTGVPPGFSGWLNHFGAMPPQPIGPAQPVQGPPAMQPQPVGPEPPIGAPWGGQPPTGIPMRPVGEPPQWGGEPPRAQPIGMPPRWGGLPVQPIDTRLPQPGNALRMRAGLQ